METTEQGIKQGPSLPKVELIKFSGNAIITLMRKLPDEGLKRKWVDRAGDLIKSKGRAAYLDFVSFFREAGQRVKNGHEKELKFSSCAGRESKESSKGKADYTLKVTTLATHSEEDQQGTAIPTGVPLKCPQCSGPHGVWSCRIFISSSLRDRSKTVRQHRLCRACLSQGHSAEQCPKRIPMLKTGVWLRPLYLIHFSVADGNGSGIKTNGHDTFRSAERNGAAKGTFADLRYVPGSIAAKIGSDNPPNTTTPLSVPVTVGVVGTSRPRVCLKVVPVKISSRNGAKEIFIHVSVRGQMLVPASRALCGS